MTICIGAICEKKYVVLATDRMITLKRPNIEYEQTGITKAIEITPTCFAETAGSALAFVEILKEALVRAGLSRNSSPTNPMNQTGEPITPTHPNYHTPSTSS